jgi:hypothetical protein
VLNAAGKLDTGELVLALGAATESVNVTADVGQVQLQSNSGERSDIIDSKQLNDVAMNGRNVIDYMKLIPGVTSSFNGAVSGTGGADAFNINGTRANQHEFTIDGASNIDTGNNGGTHVTINTDAIEEVKVLTSNYQAEFGRAAGGQIAITTKGGTKIAICPASYNDVTCAECGACAGPRSNNTIIGFPAHGSRKASIDRQLKEHAGLADPIACDRTLPTAS